SWRTCASDLLDGGSGTAAAHTLGSNVDPLFVNAAAHDFHLQPGSPAMERGVSLAAVTADFDGTPRPQGAAYDMGAYEYVLGQPPPQSASRLGVTALPAAPAGDYHYATVTAVGAGGIVFPGYLGTVHFASSDREADLPDDYTFTAADAGSHTFVFVMQTAGAQSITATDTAAPTVTGTLARHAVSPGKATTLVGSGFPSQETTGTSGQ